MEEVLKYLTDKILGLLKEPTRDNLRFITVLATCCENLSALLLYMQK